MQNVCSLFSGAGLDRTRTSHARSLTHGLQHALASSSFVVGPCPPPRPFNNIVFGSYQNSLIRLVGRDPNVDFVGTVAIENLDEFELTWHRPAGQLIAEALIDQLAPLPDYDFWEAAWGEASPAQELTDRLFSFLDDSRVSLRPQTAARLRYAVYQNLHHLLGLTLGVAYVLDQPLPDSTAAWLRRTFDQLYTLGRETGYVLPLGECVEIPGLWLTTCNRRRD